MKIAVRYQSKGGNTKAAAQEIAKIAGVRAEPFTEPLESPVDLLIIGGGVYGFSLDPELMDYLQNIDTNMVKAAAVFSTACFVKGTNKIARVLKSKGISVRKEALALKLGTANYGGKGTPTLNAEQLKSIEAFAKSLKS